MLLLFDLGDQQRHVIPEHAGIGEFLDFTHDQMKERLHFEGPVAVDEVAQAFLSIFLVFRTPSFADPVRENHQDIAGEELGGVLLIFGIGEDTDHGTSGAESFRSLSVSVRMPEEHGGIVSGVDVGQLPMKVIVKAVKESDVAAGFGRCADEPIHVGDQRSSELR